ncbi:MAG: SAM-dependent methyltransferase [Betaproteobacteria bacterium]|nr:SAM-dependent methyltransferase [Betaproteobacteria bacterium]
MNLPEPPPDALAHSAALVARITDEILRAGGWISFSRYMELALYAPGLGYYSGGAQKFGAAGDFVTAPEISPLFGQVLAAQIAEILPVTAPRVLEAGAGSGRLAVDVLVELERLGCAPERYLILDVSAELRRRQHDTLAAAAPRLLERVEWLEALPDAFSGVVLANEVLDAMPVHRVAWRDDDILERGVTLDAQGGLCWHEQQARGAIRSAAAALLPATLAPHDYVSEIGLAARAWVAEWGRRVQRGALLLIDYGFPAAEYYHPQRSMGTLMCHHRHHCLDDPFFHPGLTDLTAHVDFTAMADAGHDAGLDVLGYTSQAAFLLNCGILDRLAECASPDSPAFLRASRAVQRLTAPHEMGELFKVMALGRGLESPLMGWRRGDRVYTL